MKDIAVELIDDGTFEFEVWKDIPGYEGIYEASSLGRIKSLGNDKSRREKVLKPRHHYSGYLSLDLSKEGKPTTCRVHRLVLLAFHGKCPNGYESGHLNGVKDDNRIENLRYVTKRENTLHKSLHGTTRLGRRGKRSPLTEDDVRDIRRRYAEETKLNLANEFGVTWHTIYGIARGHTWAWVD